MFRVRFIILLAPESFDLSRRNVRIVSKKLCKIVEEFNFGKVYHRIEALQYNCYGWYHTCSSNAVFLGVWRSFHKSRRRPILLLSRRKVEISLNLTIEVIIHRVWSYHKPSALKWNWNSMMSRPSRKVIALTLRNQPRFSSTVSNQITKRCSLRTWKTVKFLVA